MALDFCERKAAALSLRRSAEVKRAAHDNVVDEGALDEELPRKHTLDGEAQGLV
jgi:hypothetical protein